MGCGMRLIKVLLFVFNFIFAVCGLGILAAGVIVHLELNNVTEHLDTKIMFPSITLMVVGSIIFVISFFGCCGAIRSSHCMIVTYASMLLFILLIQVAVAVYAFVVVKDVKAGDIRDGYEKIFNNSPTNQSNQEVVNTVQHAFQCCGVDNKYDYRNQPNFNGSLPWSCCADKYEGQVCEMNQAFNKGCVDSLIDSLKSAGDILGGIAIGIAGVELIGIIFALCLANSIRNAERRGYRV